MKGKIKVLIVDDSESVRNILTDILEQDDELEVIALASDPYEAVARIAESLPDVITLDVEMPRMDGLTFLQKLMRQHPIPVVVISSVAGEGSDLGIKALRLGASEIITKPQLSTKQQLDEYSIRIIDAVKAAALSERKNLALPKSSLKQKPTLDPGSQKKVAGIAGSPSERIILIGASTGGTEVISKILKNIRTDLPGILIVQHMPGEFTKAFANRLNQESKVNVKEAENGDVITDGSVYIANGFNHLLLDKSGGFFSCKLELGPMVNRHRPSVDVLFRSACKYSGKNITAVLLTGMGTDGAKGLLELSQVGAMTFAQDEKSSVIFGMPREAIRLNAAKNIVNPDELIEWLNNNHEGR